MTIISSCYGISLGVAVVQESSLFKWLLGYIRIGGLPVAEHYYVMAALAMGFIVLGVIALLGGIYALKRKVWRLALAGAILSIPLLPAGTIFGILSIVFLSKSKSEFV